MVSLIKTSKHVWYNSIVLVSIDIATIPHQHFTHKSLYKHTYEVRAALTLYENS